MEPYSRALSPVSRRSRHRLAPSVSAPLPVKRGFAVVVGLCLIAALVALVASSYAGAQVGAETANAAEPAISASVVATSAAVIVFLTLLNAVFSMAETAITSVRRSRLEQLVEEKRRGADIVKRLHDDPPRYIATVQAGITLLGFAASALAAVSIAPAVKPSLVPLAALTTKSLQGTESLATGYAVAVVVVAVALLTLVFGEIAPKAIAMQSPDVWALRLAPFVNVCAVIFAPLNSFALGLARLVVKPFGAKAQFEIPMISREEFRAIIETGTQKGEFDRTEQAIVENVIDFSETIVRSVMTPRTDMTAVPADAGLVQTLQTVITSGHSRLPVFENTSDTIVGIVHAKDLLPLFAGGTAPGTFDLRRVMRPPVFVPGSRRVAELLAEMRRSKNQVAVVQDEYGGTAGIVSLEDLLEEIVGDIRDEYDVDEPEMRVLSSTESVIDGRMNIGDVNDRLGTDLDNEEYTTIGGLVFGLLGHEPKQGEQLVHNGLRFVVEGVERGRVKSLRVIREKPGRTQSRTDPDADPRTDAEIAEDAPDAHAAIYNAPRDAIGAMRD